MADSVADRLLDASLEAVRALDLRLADGTAATVVKRKLPRAAERIETLPGVFICPSERPGRDEPFDSGGVNGRRLREYLIQVVVIDRAKGDNQAGLSDYLAWRQLISRRFGLPLAVAVPELMMTDVDPEVTLDRNAFVNLEYDCSALAVRFGCVEDAGS